MVKKVTKFSHIVQIGSSIARGGGLGTGANYLQGPMENAVVGLWHYEQFPPGLREVRTSEGVPLGVSGQGGPQPGTKVLFSL